MTYARRPNKIGPVAMAAPSLGVVAPAAGVTIVFWFAFLVGLMETIRGIPVFPGVAIGPALVVDQEGMRIPRQRGAGADNASEIRRLDVALAALSHEIQQNAAVVAERLSPEVSLIFDAHRKMVSDPHLRQLIVDRIEREGCTAELAVRRVLRKYADLFRNMGNSHFAERAADMSDIERRLLGQLVGSGAATLQLNQEVVVLAHDLTPSETASLDRHFVRGLAIQTGGRTSHTAIIAGAMEIPAVVGVGPALAGVADGVRLVVDGNRGVVIVDPDEATLRKYQSSQLRIQRFEESLAELRDLPAETLDGVAVKLMGNIEFPHEARHCVRRGADGIGLYRTEFLYLERDRPPTEQEHFEAYAAVLKEMGGERPVVFRTMDLGADKLGGQSEPEPNPFLGLRSVRLSLRNLTVFRTQLRALLRASTLGDVRIMFPLISTVKELRQCRLILREVMEDLQEEEIPFRRDIPVGMMVEVPSAALLADPFAREVDFFSIGTNDLIQYTLAVDRTNGAVASLYSASDPAVLSLVRGVIRAASRRNVAVNICGEMSGDPTYTMLLLGMGLRQLSVTPHNIPEIKKIIRSITLRDALKVANRVRRLETAGEITSYLKNRVRAIIPEIMDDLG